MKETLLSLPRTADLAVPARRIEANVTQVHDAPGKLRTKPHETPAVHVNYPAPAVASPSTALEEIEECPKQSSSTPSARRSAVPSRARWPSCAPTRWALTWSTGCSSATPTSTPP